MTKDEHFEHLYSTKKLKVKHFCLRYFRGYKHQTENIEDVVHEVFIKYYKNYESFRGECATDTFLLTIAKNYCLNFIRYQHCKKREHIELSLDSEKNNVDGSFMDKHSGQSVFTDAGMCARDFLKVTDHEPNALDKLIVNDSVRRIYSAIESLNPHERVVVSKICIDGMSYDDAAQELELPVNTVRSRLSRARTKLMDKLKRFKIVQS